MAVVLYVWRAQVDRFYKVQLGLSVTSVVDPYHAGVVSGPHLPHTTPNWGIPERYEARSLTTS